MVVRPDGTFITQREEPRLALIRAEPEDGGLSLSAPGAETTCGPDPRRRRLPGQGLEFLRRRGARRTGPRNGWLSRLLGYEVRLAYLPQTSVRATNPEFAPGARVSFADGYPPYW